MFDEGEYINEKFEESQVAGLMEKLFPEERERESQSYKQGS